MVSEAAKPGYILKTRKTSHSLPLSPFPPRTCTHESKHWEKNSYNLSYTARKSLTSAITWRDKNPFKTTTMTVSHREKTEAITTTINSAMKKKKKKRRRRKTKRKRSGSSCQ
jgi:hypothetical protein